MKTSAIIPTCRDHRGTIGSAVDSIVAHHLDYCPPAVCTPEPWRRAVRICGRVFVAVIGFVVVVVGMVVWIGTIPPDLDRTLIQSKLKPMPASFILARSSAHGPVDQSALYAGTMSPKDATDLIAQLAAAPRGGDESPMPVTIFNGSPPQWWTSPTWNDRRSFNIWANDVWTIHISPSTGAVEIECERF